MKVELTLSQRQLTLKLVSGSKLLDSLTTSYRHNLENQLITSLDKLLKRNRLELKSIKGYALTSELGDEATGTKITQSFLAALQIRF